MPTVLENSSPCAKTCLPHFSSFENGKVKEKEEEDGCTSHRSALESSTPLWYRDIQKIFMNVGWRCQALAVLLKVQINLWSITLYCLQY